MDLKHSQGRLHLEFGLNIVDSLKVVIHEVEALGIVREVVIVVLVDELLEGLVDLLSALFTNQRGIL